MKKYAFRLETVRRVRRTQEDLAKAGLARANNEVTEAIAVVEARIARYENAVQLPTSNRANVDHFMKNRYFNELAGQAVVAARASLNAAQTEAAAHKAIWSDAAMRVKTLDRLDERRRAEYDIDFTRDEVRQVDDVVSGSYARKAAAAGIRVVGGVA